MGIVIHRTDTYYRCYHYFIIYLIVIVNRCASEITPVNSYIIVYSSVRKRQIIFHCRYVDYFRIILVLIYIPIRASIQRCAYKMWKTVFAYNVYTAVGTLVYVVNIIAIRIIE